jgi:hypothetical protein
LSARARSATARPILPGPTMAIFTLTPDPSP